MATYYVDFVNGNDANNGLGPDASHASNKPWKTVTKLLGAAGMASGDTAYLAPGVFRENVTVAMTSATAETKIIGDYANAQGFKTSGGVLVAPREVVVTSYLTDDKTAPTSGACITLQGRDFLTFEDIMFVSYPGLRCIDASTTTSTDCKFTRCVFQRTQVNNSGLMRFDVAFGVALNLTIDSCLFMDGGTKTIYIRHTSGTGSDWDLNVQIRNCSIIAIGGACVGGEKLGASANTGGGIDVQNCVLWTRDSCFQTNLNGAVTTSIPCTLYNSICFSQNACLVSAATGELTEDYNLLCSITPRTNVTAGSNSKTDLNYSYHMECGQSFLRGRIPRPFFSPTVDSPVLGFGNQAGYPTTDGFGMVRPSGPGAFWANALPGIGYAEFPHYGVRETSVVADGSNAMKLTGPGVHRLDVRVNNVSTTLSVKVRYDTNHGTTNKPRATLVANAVLGVTAETKTATVGVDTWETLTFTAFTPSSAGVVTLELESRSAAGNGLAYFDTISVT